MTNTPFFHIKLGSACERLRPVWYMCLKIENCCLKTFLKIHVDEKMCENTYNIV